MRSLKPHIITRIFFFGLSILFILILIVLTFDGITMNSIWSENTLENLTILLGYLIFGWSAIYLFLFINGSKLAIKKECLVIKTWENKFHNIRLSHNKLFADFLLPKSKVDTIEINRISNIIVGNLEDIEVECETNYFTEALHEIRSFKSEWFKKFKRESYRISQLNSKNYLYIRCYSNKNFFVDVSLTSKKSTYRFLDTMSEINPEIVLKKSET